MTETTQVRFKRPYQGYKGGQVATVTKGLARSLVLFGRVELLEHPLIETAVAPVPAELEQAVALPAKKKRGRPRKVVP